MSATVGPVQEPVKTRTYRSPVRRERAAATRGRVLAAARNLFLERGYVRTTAREIAARAGVSLDTVYAAAGRKPQIMLELVEEAISGQDGWTMPEEIARWNEIAPRYGLVVVGPPVPEQA